MNLTLSGSRLAAFGGLYFGLGTALGLGLAGFIRSVRADWHASGRA